MYNPFMMNKRAQMAEGLTWVFATIVIIVILLFSIFITSDFFGFNNRDIPSESFESSALQKSLLSYLLTNENGKIVYSSIKSEENLKGSFGTLASKIFNGLYEETYSGIWMGVLETGSWPEGRVSNEFFDKTSLLAFYSEMSISTLRFSPDKLVIVAFFK